MAGKPELSAAPGLQNVVVYVSNDNFAQAYAVGQQNVPQNTHQAVHNGGYPNPPHSMATVVGPSKNYVEKQILKPPDYSGNGQVINGSVQQQGNYFTGVISQNGFQQPIVNNISYQNGAVLKNYGSSEVLSSGDRQSGPGRPDAKVRDECDNRESYGESGYVTVMGAEGPSQSVRCDSVRSEAAESSCSSLSSADEGLVVVQGQPPEMVVYDSSVSVRPGGVVLAVGPPSMPQQPQNNTSVVGTLPTNHQPSITVPNGWKRLLNNGAIVYISPSNTALSSPEQVKEYLLSAGTCKCGLECHFKYDNIFNFDPKVASKPWILSPDTNTGDLTKLCNHKRKIIAMASLDCKPPDPNSKLRKDYNVKRKKRKIGMPYAGGVSVSQFLAQREKLALNQQHNFNKETMGNTQQQQQQMWPQSPGNNPQMASSSRLQGYPESPQNHHLIRCQDQSGNRILTGSPMVLGDTMVVSQQQQTPPTNISHQQIQQNQQQMSPHMPPNNPNLHIQHQQIIGPNGQIISVQGPMNPPSQSHNQTVVNQIQNPNSGIVIQGQNVVQNPQPPHQQHRIYINGQPNEPSGPGRPGNIQMIPVSIANQQRQDLQQRMQQQFYNQYNPQQFDPSKNIRPFNQVMNGYRPQGIQQQSQQNNQILQTPVMVNPQQKVQWQNRMQPNVNQMPPQMQNPPIQQHNNTSNVYERVPPLHQHTPPPTIWQDEVKRKKVKMGKMKNRPSYHVMDACQSNSHAPCPNIDVRQIPNDNSRAVIINQLPHNSQSAPSPSFMEDPSGYLAQQTALLNNTINRQTGANGCTGYVCNSPVTSMQQNPQQQHNIIAVSMSNSQANEVPLPSNIMMSHMKPQQHQQHQQPNRPNQNITIVKTQQQVPQNIVLSQTPYGQMQMQQNMADSSMVGGDQHQHVQCQGCVADSMNSNPYLMKDSHNKMQGNSRPNSEPGTPSSSGASSEDPVTSSTYLDKHNVNQASPDSRPIQGGTVSTSNVSPVDGMQSDPPTPNPHTPTPPVRNPPDTSQLVNTSMPFAIYQQHQNQIQQQINQSREAISSINYPNMVISKQESCCSTPHGSTGLPRMSLTTGVVTTMASGRTVGSNTITSVLAGRANTATVSINSPATISGSSTPTSVSGLNTSAVQTQANVNVSKSPLEMVQSVVSSIQVPQQPNVISSAAQSNPQMSPHIIKHSPTGLPPGHILVSSGGQLIMASTGNGQGVMAPPPPKLVTNQGAMPPISVSPMITNVTASVTQVIPAVAQQVLGQQTVLVNALPAPFVLQPGVTMTMDGMTVGQNMQIPQLVAGNVIQQQIQLDSTDPRRAPTATLLSPEGKKKGKKRKMASQTVASMLHIAAAQQNSGVVMSQQGFPQQIQMAHSPQGPVMQALTIVPSKNGGPPQIVMNGQPMANANIGTQQLITNSQPAQQINLLQPVNLINGTTGVVQNFPTIQQFIVPNLGGMVMNPDGTATILQDTSNIGMQLQLQNVNGQNVLTPVQNNSMFNGGQSILAAGPAGMVIRAPTSQGKIIQQQHSPGAQFLSPNGSQFVVNGAQFSGQLSPLVASVSPSQQVTFGTSTQPIRPNNSIQPTQQEYIQCGQMGQTLMVPCTPAANIAVSSSNQQNTTYVQQNTTIVQQQTTMVSNNQQLQQNYQSNNQQQNQSNVARAATLNLDQNFIISSNDNKQVQAVVLQRDNSQNSAGYRQSVSTQTAVNQNSQSVTTNTFCQTSTISAGSPPDTTTHSPMASGGQSPPTVDTTTHSGSTDDGLSPAPSNCSATCEITIPGRQQSCTMAMVHCISSSEPDSADLNLQTSEHDWRRSQQMSSTPKPEYTDITSGQMHFSKKSTPTHVAFAESSIGLQFISDHIKSQDAVESSRNYEKMMQKRKNSDTLVVMETRHMHSSLFEEDDEEDESSRPKSLHTFVIGNLVWGPAKGCPAWPGKIVEVEEEDDKVSVLWFGGEKHVTKVDASSLQTLSEGLDAHHRAGKKSRTSRKLNGQLEKAIQEAMAELDKESDQGSKEPSKPLKPITKITSAPIVKKTTGRLRSSQR